MTSKDRIQEFLGLKRFAFVGVSRQPGDFSRTLFREFLARGYQAVPVNPDAQEIEGQPCFAHLKDVQPPVEAALFMTAPAVTESLVEECPAAHVTRVWMFRGAGQGAATPNAIRFCEAQGISVIPGECPFMFLPGQAWFHRVHGFVRRITGSYPR
ncbi:MAG: CoA-binding protein [Bryobacteraceae bacterium]